MHPEHWCKDSEAKDKRGRRVDWSDGHAHAFSVVGAIQAATKYLTPPQRTDALSFVGYVAKCKGTKALQEWNDRLGTTHEDVAKAIDAAIALIERHEGPWQHEFDL